MKNLHVVSHTHWDREWYLTFQQFRMKLVRLVDLLLDLLASDPGYACFTLDGQMIVLEDYLEVRPQNAGLLRPYIQEGRILVGPWYILPDEFLVSPEATVRNLLEGQRLAEIYGQRMLIGYTPDCFGHIGQLPQILHGFGIDTACLQRGLGEEPCELWWDAPDGSRVLLLNLRDSYGNGQRLRFDNFQDSLEELDREGKSLEPWSRTGEILIMQGTDHQEPATATSAGLAFFNNNQPDWKAGQTSLAAYRETVTRQISQHGIEFPVIRGELRSPQRSHLLPGVLSTRMWIKQANQRCETLLERWAEPFSTLASLLLNDRDAPQSGINLYTGEQVPRPADLVRQAWRILMTCHPHDSICGCSIDEVHGEMRPRFAQVEQIGAALTDQSLTSLARRIDTQSSAPAGAISALVVFNPTGLPRTDRIEVALPVSPELQQFSIRDDRGSETPSVMLEAKSKELYAFDLTPQELMGLMGLFQSGSFAGKTARSAVFKRDGGNVSIDVQLADGGNPDQQAVQQALATLNTYLADSQVECFHIRLDILEQVCVAFTASEVPPFGYRTYWACPGVEASTEKPPDRENNRIENEFFQVEVNPADGTLAVIDRRTQVRFTGLNRFVDGGDRGDLYNYCPPENDLLVPPHAITTEVKRGNGFEELAIQYTLDIPTGLAVDRASRGSVTVPMEITSRVRVSPGVQRIDIHSEVANAARDHRLRVHFPAPFPAQDADYDGHFEVVRRPLELPAFDSSWIENPRPEKPQRSFTDLSNGETGLMVAARGLPEVEAFSMDGDRSELALTLLRCTGWLSRGDLTNRRGDAGPELETPGAQMPGSWSFDYAVIPHAGGWQAAAPEAWAFAVPMRAEVIGLHTGDLPGVHSFVSQDQPLFAISTLKPAEDRHGWILRGCSLAAEPFDVHIRVNLPISEVLRVRLDETGGETLQVRDGAISTEIRAHEVVTFKFTTGEKIPY